MRFAARGALRLLLVRRAARAVNMSVFRRGGFRQSVMRGDERAADQQREDEAGGREFALLDEGDARADPAERQHAQQDHAENIKAAPGRAFVAVRHREKPRVFPRSLLRMSLRFLQ